MHLVRLSVRSFRNLAALEVDIPQNGVVVIGENGQGKTNLLEAVYYLMLFRSLRGASDRELVRFGENGFHIGGVAAGGNGAGVSGRQPDVAAGSRLTAAYESASGRKKVTVNGAEPYRLSDAVGQVLAVPFSPADTALVTGGPSLRRRFLDIVLSMSQAGYLARLSDLRMALQQRNAALRRGRAEEARGFDTPLAVAAGWISDARQRWVAERSERFTELCAALGEGELGEMHYHSQVPAWSGPDEWSRRLGATLERDLKRGATTTGPHRDDLKMALGARDLRVYGSAGQHRTAAIALRILEVETLKSARGTPPIGLYDDVFAELDEARQSKLLKLMRDSLPGQSIVVAPRDAEIPPELLDRPRWRMAGGRLV